MGDRGFLAAHATKFPINGQYVSALAMGLAVTAYVVVSLLTCRQNFNMNRLLNRGQYALDAQGRSAPAPEKPPRTWRQLVGIDDNFTRGDRFIAGALFIWSMFWFTVFVVVTIWNLPPWGRWQPWPTEWWARYWFWVGIIMPIVLGTFTSIWFTWGGVRDLRRLFDKLRVMQSDASNEARYPQVQALAPNVAVLPWGATEAHNQHLPHGTDTIEATRLGEEAVTRANAAGARCLLLPTVPFGNNNQQLAQAATITMRTATQHAVLRDVADSLVMQGNDRLVLLNFHGGNEFKSMIRDVMLATPIFIVQVHGYELADIRPVLDNPKGSHASEFETSLMLYLAPEWVEMSDAGTGQTTPYKIKTLERTSGVWAPRNWAALTRDTGDGDPRQATSDKGGRIFEALLEPLAVVLIELSAAKKGDFPFCLARPHP